MSTGDMIDVRGIEPGELLAALYNRAVCLGLGELQYDPRPMTADEARELIGKMAQADGSWSVDYLRGRPLKIQIADGILRGALLYDRDQGAGLCARIVESLRRQR